MAQGTGWVQIGKDTWQYDEDGVRFFLLAGTERAVLLDSGMHTRNAHDLAQEQCNLPIMLLHTHCDIDHVGSDDQFEEVWVSPAELVHPSAPHDWRRVRPLWDGDVIDLGNRPLEVIALPGHTPGSVAFLDQNSGMLFSGDPIQRNGRIFCFGPMRSMAAYIHSLERLQTRVDEIASIWPCHATCPVDMSTIAELIEGAKAVEAGEASFAMDQVHGTPVRAYDVGVSVLLCNAG